MTEGFAAVVGMRATALDDLARVLYHAGRVQHELHASTPVLQDRPRLTLDHLVLDPPTFMFRRPVVPTATPGTIRLGLQLRARGPVTIDTAGIPAETLDSVVELHVIVETRAVLVGGRLGITINPATAQLATFSVTPFEGTSFSLANRHELRRDDLREILELGLQIMLTDMLANQGQLLPPFDISFLGPLATSAGATARLATDDDRLLLGIDVSLPASGVVPAITTAGNLALLRDICGDSDLAMATDPRLMSTAFSGIATGISTMATQQGGTLTSFSIGVAEGHIPVAGRVSHDAGTLDFSLKATPRITQGSTPSGGSIVVGISDLAVTVTPAWWAVLLTVLTAGLAYTIVEFFSSYVRTNVVSGVITRPPTDAGAVQRTFSLPGITDPVIAMAVNRFECHPDGMLVGLSLKPAFRKPKLTGPTHIDIQDLAIIHASPVTYTLDLGHEAIAEDPFVRVRWEVRGADGRQWVVRDGRLRDVGAKVELFYVTLPWLQQANYTVSCRLYRTRGYVTEELLNETRSLSVLDRLDRTRPYVRWIHQVMVPMVTVQPDGSRTQLGDKVVTRRSKLHRTAFPGRCRMVSKYSLTWLSAPASVPGPVLEYLDDLPFPVADLATHRGEVCDYCFYGGPTKNVPLALP